MSSSKPAVPDPAQIGKFQVLKTLGAGAMGTVYKAMDPELGRLVAIKTIRLEGLAASQSSLEDLVERFKREAKLAARLKHPNIVIIHEINSTPGNSYLVMEYVDGAGLDRLIKTAGRMSAERAASIGAQVADALAYAHKHNVVHRDIKPANIMIEPGDHVKVTDFGIAKATDMADHLTATGSLLGTPSYMSPEQARGQKVDGRSDLFSVGCILYEMVGGQKAFRGDTLTAIMFKIITEEPQPLRELDPTVSDEMLRVVAKALSKDPATRYQSGRELADDLLAITRPGFVPTLRAAEVPTLPPDASPADLPTVASSATLRSEVTMKSAPTTAQPPALPAAAGGLALPPTILTPQPKADAPPPLPKPTARPPQPPVSRPPARRTGAGAGLLVGLGLVAVLGLAAIVGGAWFVFGRKGTAPEPSPSAETTPVAETNAPAEATPAVPGGSTTAEPVPSPVAPPPTAIPAPTATPSTVRVTGVPRPQPPPTTPPIAPAPADEPSATGAAGEYGYLDELPTDAPDGRVAGEALAQKYRSGGSSNYSSARFRARPRFPPGTTVLERPAMATLYYVHQAEEAFHRKNGRYGNARELADSGFLRLDVPVTAEGFRRARYGFRVSASGDSYRADAILLGGNGRSFMVDDSGFVRFANE